MIFTKVKILSIITATSLFTNGIILSLHWNGEQSLRKAEEIAKTYKSKVETFQKQTEELEKLAVNQNSDITLLINRIKDLEKSTKELNKELDTYYIEIEQSKKEAGIIGNTINIATKEVEKANNEISKANKDAANHNEVIKNILDDSQIGSVKEIKRIDIKNYIKIPNDKNLNTSRLNIHTRNLDEYKGILFTKWFNSVKISDTDMKGISSVDVFLSPDGLLGIFPCYTGCDSNFNNFKNCFQGKKFLDLPVVVKKAR